MIGFRYGEIGGVPASIVEPEILTTKLFIESIWVKEKLDLVELARLRWVEKWTIEKLPRRFGVRFPSYSDYASKVPFLFPRLNP